MDEEVIDTLATIILVIKNEWITSISNICSPLGCVTSTNQKMMRVRSDGSNKTFGTTVAIQWIDTIF
jgi:hypothetical protein